MCGVHVRGRRQAHARLGRVLRTAMSVRKKNARWGTTQKGVVLPEGGAQECLPDGKPRIKGGTRTFVCRPARVSAIPQREFSRPACRRMFAMQTRNLEFGERKEGVPGAVRVSPAIAHKPGLERWTTQMGGRGREVVRVPRAQQERSTGMPSREVICGRPGRQCGVGKEGHVRGGAEMLQQGNGRHCHVCYTGGWRARAVQRAGPVVRARQRVASCLRGGGKQWRCRHRLCSGVRRKVRARKCFQEGMEGRSSPQCLQANCPK